MFPQWYSVRNVASVINNLKYISNFEYSIVSFLMNPIDDMYLIYSGFSLIILLTSAIVCSST